LDLEFRDRLDRVIQSIEKARMGVSLHHIVKIVAVSKYTDSHTIQKLYEVGQRAFGESKVQDFEKKYSELENLPIEWHFIGRLQKNKVNKLISLRPSLLQSLDSIELAKYLNERLEQRGEKLNALLQINSSREPQKAGVAPEQAIDVYQEILERFPNIRLKGVMAIGKHSPVVDEVRQSFREVYQIYEKLQKDGASICSMGMSGDFEIAISEGSNMVRLGSILIR